MENNATTLVPLALTALEANREHAELTHTLIVRSALLLVCAAADMALANKARCPDRLHPVARSSARVRAPSLPESRCTRAHTNGRMRARTLARAG